MATAQQTKDPILPTEEETNLAKESFRRLASQSDKPIRLAVGNGEAATLELPHVAVTLLLRLLGEIARGNAVTVIPYHAELTTQQAADVLNVSRPFLIKLLEKGELPFHRVGTHRRIRFKDVMDFKTSLREKQREALDALTKEAQDLDMGY
jgi:excisionase family DNA binding protein